MGNPNTKHIIHNNQPSVESIFAWGGLGENDIFDSSEGNVAELYCAQKVSILQYNIRYTIAFRIGMLDARGECITNYEGRGQSIQ